ncbi:MAG: hypothetical protein U0840_12295 [Gemmataceae bacterium]
MLMIRVSALTAVVVFFSLVATGCGPGKADVSGTVNLDGKPVHSGKIVFIPAQGVAVSGPVDNGKYSLKGVPSGEAVVTVDNIDVRKAVEQASKYSEPKGGTGAGAVPGGAGANMPPEAKAALEKQMQAMAEGAKRTKDLIANYRAIPEKYADPKATDLKFKVGSSATFDIDLKSK